ncbi:MAG TPA: hypothetical protein VFA83_25020 [Acidimicrobiales bacterium]|nr:hypothetical protein [Acidimicrobiales bacterium]
MSFFDDFPPPPSPPELPRFERKPWMGPPPGWVGGWVPWRVVLTRTADAYTVITDVAAFPSGVEFAVVSRFRPGTFDPHARPGGPPFRPGYPGGPMFGVGFADGRKAMFARPFPPPLEDEPDGPVLTPRAGGGSADEWRMGMWLWPLPPPGPLTFVTAWAERGEAEHAATVDAAELVDAASRAEKLWDVDEDPPAGGFASGGGYFTSQAVLAKRPDDKRPAQPPT